MRLMRTEVHNLALFLFQPERKRECLITYVPHVFLFLLSTFGVGQTTGLATVALGIQFS